MYILLVDDDSINNFVNKELLSQVYPDANINAFENPMFALSFLLESTDVEPDLILLDLNMPFLTGWQFLDKLKENGLNYRVVILTSSINPMDKQKAEDYPLIDGFLIKPIEMEKLVEIREEIRKNNEQTKA